MLLDIMNSQYDMYDAIKDVKEYIKELLEL
jgi:hypothetical protein